MNNDKLNKLRNYLIVEYPKDSWFRASELNLAEINAYSGTQGWREVVYLIDVLVGENFLIKDYRFGKFLYQINPSKITEKENRIVEKSKNNNKTDAPDIKKKKNATQVFRNQKSASNEIVAHDFEKKKQQLQKFAKTLPKTSSLPSVRGGNHWYGASVKATGDDLNNLSERIADSLIEQNKNIVGIRKEFISIYDTFEALDKDYIQRILVNLKAAEEANTKAVKGLEQNKKLFNSQKTIIEVLKKHKDELDKLKHLKEIDEFYNAYTNFEAYQEKNIEELRASQENIDAKFLAHQKIYNQFSDKQSVEVAKLQNSQKKFSNELDGLSDTIRNFDESMSKEMSAQKTRIDDVFSRVAQDLKDIQSEAESKVETLSSDINKIVLNQKKGFDDKLENLDDTVKKLEESNLEMIDELKSTRDEAFAKIAKKIEENQNESLAQVKSIHSEMEEQLNEMKEYFQNQLKTTRLLAIISFIAFIILLVLILSEVI